MRVVLDTSVLVAAWRSRDGASFALLRKLRAGDFAIAVSVPLVVEYEAVLRRHAVHPFTPEDVEAFVDYLCHVAVRQEVFYLWRPLLRDPNDDMLVELAVAAACDAIVTHNTKDFAAAAGVVPQLLTPAELLLELARRKR